VIRRMINHAVDKRVDEIIEKFCPHSEWKTIASVYTPRGPLARRATSMSTRAGAADLRPSP